MWMRLTPACDASQISEVRQTRSASGLCCVDQGVAGAVNLTDPVFRGHYHGRKKHDGASCVLVRVLVRCVGADARG